MHGPTLSVRVCAGLRLVVRNCSVDSVCSLSNPNLNFFLLMIYFSAYGGTLDSTGNQWLTPVVGTVIIMDTVGMTMLSILIGMLNFLPECIYVYILQNQGMGY